MRQHLLFLFIIIFSGCEVENNYHDGKYKATIYAGGSFFNIHTEVITIKGNEILNEKYTLMNSPADKIKVSCVQFPDRVEFKEDKGITRILTLQKDGSLRLNADAIFRKWKEGDEETLKEKIIKPLIKQQGNKIIFNK